MIVNMDAAFNHGTVGVLCIGSSFSYFQKSDYLCVDGMQEVKTHQ